VVGAAVGVDELLPVVVEPPFPVPQAATNNASTMSGIKDLRRVRFKSMRSASLKAGLASWQTRKSPEARPGDFDSFLIKKYVNG
jgi:hypothetical protein